MNDKLLLELFERVVTLEEKVAALEKAAANPQSETVVVESFGEVKGKYRYLSDYLLSSDKDIITLTFSKIEEIIGEKLPPSAREHRAMWANTQTHSLSRAWFNIGFRTTEVDIDNERAKFERVRFTSEGKATMSKYEPLGQYLEKSGKEKVELSFSEIENILGFKLIDSLRKHQIAWYGAAEKSPTHVWKKVWCSYGYQVETVNLDEGCVVFCKV
ncbi:MAG: hypothetical protein FWE62_04365 [Firmicutes bacterium]|nr:hypothetical protein [Bacillota bacterium]